MNIAQRFNNLDGKTVGRRSLERIANKANEVSHTEIYDRINKILKEYPEVLEFSIEIKDKISKPTKGLGQPTAKTEVTTLFNKEVLIAKRNGIHPRKILKLGKASGELAKIVGTKEIRISGKVIKKAMEKDNSHIMTWDNFINLPDYLNEPLAIFKSKRSGFIILTEILNFKKKPIIVPLHIVEKGKFIEIKSLYSRINDNIYRRWKEEGLVLFENKKSSLLFKVFKETISSVDNKLHNKNTKKRVNSKRLEDELKKLGIPYIEVTDFVDDGIRGFRKIHSIRRVCGFVCGF